MSSDSDEDKQHEPSQKKLDDARKKGEVPRSTELNIAASYAGILLVSISLGGISIVSLGNVLTNLIKESGPLSTEIFSNHPQAVLGGAMTSVASAVAPWFAIPALAVILSILSQKSFGRTGH